MVSGDERDAASVDQKRIQRQVRNHSEPPKMQAVNIDPLANQVGERLVLKVEPEQR